MKVTRTEVKKDAQTVLCYWAKQAGIFFFNLHEQAGNRASIKWSLFLSYLHSWPTRSPLLVPFTDANMLIKMCASIIIC